MQLPSLAYDQILHQLSQNGLTGGYFQTTNGSRTPASNIDYNNLLNNLVWELYGLDLIGGGGGGVNVTGKLRIKGATTIG
jgi:hypothetical protein